MPEIIFVKPAEGLRVVNPATGLPLPAEGDSVENGTYWIRRLNDGDVTEQTPPATPTSKANSKKE
jgi:hypothetical protein